MIMSARSPTPCTLTMMLPVGRVELGVTVTTVALMSMLSVDGSTLPFGPVITMFFEVSVLASGSSLKVMVIGALALTQVASSAGTTLVTIDW